MAPAQVVEVKDLPPEVLGQHDPHANAADGAAAQALTATSTSAEPAPAHAFADSVSVSTGADSLKALEALVLDSPVSPVPAGLGMPAPAASAWELGLEHEALALLTTGRTDVWDEMTRRFETRLIQAALTMTRGRRIEAAQKLGIGRNTITRKIQELGLDDA